MVNIDRLVALCNFTAQFCLLCGLGWVEVAQDRSVLAGAVGAAVAQLLTVTGLDFALVRRPTNKNREPLYKVHSRCACIQN